MREARSGSLTLSLMLLVAFFAYPNWSLGNSSSQDNTTLPFSSGERMVFTVHWDPPWYLFFLPSLEAGEAELLIAGEEDRNDFKAIKIVFRARSSGRLTSLLGMKVDDEFMFISEPETFCSLSNSQKIREGKRKRQINVEYLRASGQVHIREVDESANPPILKKNEIKEGIPSCVQDPLSAIYLLRMSPLYEKYSRLFTIANDDKVKTVRAIVDRQEIVETPAGSFAAWRISTDALKGGLFKEGGQFSLWLSADEKKLPVQFEVKLRLGRTLGKLKSVTNGSD